MTTNRREFLLQSAGATTLLASGWTLPGFLAQTAHAAGPGDSDHILVIVQLSGGNDGLNTVIPYRDDAYHRARPTLRIPENRVLRLNDELGLHPDMEALKGVYDDGALSVITNVGYPNPDRSHFRSMDIWHSAMLDPDEADTGWLGRVIDLQGATGSPTALHLDDDVLPLALRAAGSDVPSVRDISAFRLEGGPDGIEPSLRATRDSVRDDLLYVQRTAVDSCATARRLAAVTEDDTGQRGAYPNRGLARRLQQIARLIDANFGARIYYTSIGGFDTHARQELAHGPLLREVSDSLAAFQRDLDARGLNKRVLTMTFSEFGRRVNENGSRGTDHGAAAPMFVMGGRAGVIGSAPDLDRLQEGDVRHEVDFRSVYAGVLDGWLGVDSRAVLGKRFQPLKVS